MNGQEFAFQQNFEVAEEWFQRCLQEIERDTAEQVSGKDALITRLNICQFYLIWYRSLIQPHFMEAVVSQIQLEVDHYERNGALPPRDPEEVRTLFVQLQEMERRLQDPLLSKLIKKAKEHFELAWKYPFVLWTQINEWEFLLDTHETLLASPAQVDVWLEIVERWKKYRKAFFKKSAFPKGEKKKQGGPALICPLFPAFKS